MDAPCLYPNVISSCSVSNASLPLAFFVNAQYQSLIRWIHVQTNNIIQLLNKLLVTAQLNCLYQVGLKVVLIPYSPNRCFTHPLSSSHSACTPMSCMGRLSMRRRLYHLSNFLCWDFWQASGTRSIFFQASQTKSQKPTSPELYGRSCCAKPQSNILIQDTIRCPLNNLRSLNQSYYNALHEY